MCSICLVVLTFQFVLRTVAIEDLYEQGHHNPKALQWPKSWSNMEDPVVPLERNLYGHRLARLLWERQFEKTLLKYGWEKVSSWD